MKSSAFDVPIPHKPKYSYLQRVAYKCFFGKMLGKYRLKFLFYSLNYKIPSLFEEDFWNFLISLNAYNLEVTLRSFFDKVFGKIQVKISCFLFSL